MDRPVRILLLVTGQAVPRVEDSRGGFVALFREGLTTQDPRVELAVLDVTACDQTTPLPPLTAYDGLVMTGSPAMVGENSPWMQFGASLIREAICQQVPFLGVCFGHQLLGIATGSDVGPNPRGREMGTVEVDLSPSAQDPLLGSMPRRFAAQVSHVDVIRVPSAALKVVGTSGHDPCHVVRAGETAWGVQFHPEFDEAVSRMYIETRTDALERERGPGATQHRLATLRPSNDAADLLAHFTRFCKSRRQRPGTPHVESTRCE